MTYTAKILKKIGREVVDKHPSIASVIMQELPSPECTDLDRLPEFFQSFCRAYSIHPESLNSTEKKKIFLAAMISLYHEPFHFKTEVSKVLKQDRSFTSRMIKEVNFRVRKDPEFQEQVNFILSTIKQTIN